MNRFYKNYFKRIFDLSLIFISLPIIFPIFLIIFLLVKLNLGSPVFFKQLRPGLNGVIFNLYKFRTMTKELDNTGKDLPDEKRLSKFGQYLRSTSLDELPELWNIIKGDMSLVGPRPLLTEYLPLYSKKQYKRHEVKPGLTGWAQVNGRNAISWKKKLELDVIYVDNLSFWLDIKILCITMKKVILRDGINNSNHITMDKFQGN